MESQRRSIAVPGRRRSSRSPQCWPWRPCSREPAVARSAAAPSRARRRRSTDRHAGPHGDRRQGPGRTRRRASSISGSSGSSWVRTAMRSRATSKNYLVAPGDVDKTLRVQVTATDATARPARARSRASVVSSNSAPVNTAAPTVSGPPRSASNSKLRPAAGPAESARTATGGSVRDRNGASVSPSSMRLRRPTASARSTPAAHFASS